MAVSQGKLCFVMVEFGFMGPTLRVMALPALLTQVARMNIAVTVATHTRVRRLTEFFPLHMTGCARRVTVPPEQLEIGGCVIKCLGHQ